MVSRRVGDHLSHCRKLKATELGGTSVPRLYRVYGEPRFRDAMKSVIFITSQHKQVLFRSRPSIHQRVSIYRKQCVAPRSIECTENLQFQNATLNNKRTSLPSTHILRLAAYLINCTSLWRPFESAALTRDVQSWTRDHHTPSPSSAKCRSRARR